MNSEITASQIPFGILYIYVYSYFVSGYLIAPYSLIEKRFYQITITKHTYIITWYLSVQDQQKSEHSKPTKIRTFNNTGNNNKRNHHKKLKIYFTNKRKPIMATVEKPDMVADTRPSSNNMKRPTRFMQSPCFANSQPSTCKKVMILKTFFSHGAHS